MDNRTERQKYLRLLAQQYPNVRAASSEIIHLQAILSLPKGTEHFMSDLHGEYEAFLHILNSAGEHIGTVRQRVLTFLPKFDLYEFDRCIGTIKKEFTFFVPHFTVEGSDWAVEGQFMEWDYTIVSASRGTVATIGKELFHWTDTYVIDVADPADALHALMVVLAIDAEKCSRSN